MVDIIKLEDLTLDEIKSRRRCECIISNHEESSCGIDIQ